MPQFAIVPLGADEEHEVDYHFSLAKTPIKYLEYASFGIPGLYSNHPIYKQIISNGVNGILVNNNFED